MTGGLINIVTYGATDLFLSGNPEITFFKIVYRRYTNFSIESYRLSFDDPTGFGKISTINVPRVGDSIHKVYLEINTPQLAFAKPAVLSSTQTALFDKYSTDVSNYNLVEEFMSINMASYRAAYAAFVAQNTTVANMISAVTTTFTSYGSQGTTISTNFGILATGDGFNMSVISLLLIVTPIDPTSVSKSQLMSIIDIGLENSILADNFYQNEINVDYTAWQNSIASNYNFAWVDKLGHSIIDYVDVFIGGAKIDRHYGDWVNIWWELAGNKNMKDTYYKMIGNVTEMTTFDGNIKPAFTMYIPLQFWFNRYNGLALPLAALEYDKLNFTVKFRNFQDVSYIENPDIVNNSIPVSLNDQLADLGLDMQANILIDYIFLSSSERRKFAQSNHEYLIEQSNVLLFDNIVTNNPSMELDFFHPVKEILFVAQKNSYLSNDTSFTKCRYDNYSYSVNGKGNWVCTMEMLFNGVDRVSVIDGNFFNYLQPYQAHRNTPADGINCYSFSFNPEEHQPSGTCDFSKLSHTKMFLTVNNSMFSYNLSDFIDNGVLVLKNAGVDNQVLTTDIIIRLYATNYNILRIFGGMGKLAFE